MGYVVIVRLPFLEQEVLWMLNHQRAESVMMMPVLGLAIGFFAHMLVLPSRIVAPKQQPKSEQKSLNYGNDKRTKERHTCLSRITATSTT
jgi:hypothetical protein